MGFVLARLLCLLALLGGVGAQNGVVTEPLTLTTSIVGSTTNLLPRLSTFFPPGTYFGNGTVLLGQTTYRRAPPHQVIEFLHYLIKCRFELIQKPYDLATKYISIDSTNHTLKTIMHKCSQLCWIRIIRTASRQIFSDRIGNPSTHMTSKGSFTDYICDKYRFVTVCAVFSQDHRTHSF